MTDKSREDSLRKRYLYKLLTNFFGLGIGACTQAIIPRGLGPKAYGDYNFLLNFFTQFTNFFDMGSSTGLYTKLSQRPKEFKLVSYYFYFIAAIAALTVLFVILAQLSGFYTLLWPNQLLYGVYLAGFLGISVWVLNVMVRVADAFCLTTSTEIAKMLQKVSGLIIIAMLYIGNRLTLGIVFITYICISVLLAVSLYYIFRYHGYGIFKNLKITLLDIKKYTAELYEYSHPLFLYGFIVMLAGILERWLLQVFAGSVEQGFFGLSYQIGAICFMFTSAMTPLIIREFSIAFNNKDINLMARLFRKHIPLLYSITALLACFVAVNADMITVMMGGGKFRGAILAVTVMAFYPIHQVYGQLSGAVFYASDRTKLYSRIGIISVIIGLPVTFFLIAPKKFFGLEAGALGLACATVLTQFLAVNAQLYFNSKMLGLKFHRYLIHQLAAVAVFLALSVFSRSVIDNTLSIGNGLITGFIFCGILYLTMAFIVVYFFPLIAGLRRENLKGLLKIS